MIDVWGVVANALWVLGLSLLLAVVSWATWRAKDGGASTRELLAWGSLRRGVDVALLLFCAGLAATSTRVWERVVWAVLAAFWMMQAVTRRRGEPCWRQNAETQRGRDAEGGGGTD